MINNGIKLCDLVDIKNPKSVIKEIKYIISLMVNDFDYSILEHVNGDIEKVFAGKYPGYRASSTKYHDLEHTKSVVLATIRLIHGGFIEGHTFSSTNILLGLIAAFFHDIGYIQSDSDLIGSGAKYTVGHEIRSIDFMEKYLSQKSFSPQDIKDCSNITMCTILKLSPKDIPFHSMDIKMLGKIVGSADFLAQMADREYLEKLFLLFKEFEEAGMSGYGSELELLKKTEDFYEFVAKKRLIEEFDNVSVFMQSHFKDRWEMDRNLYEESIVSNINYIKSVTMECVESYECYFQYLRRGGIEEKLQNLALSNY